MSIDRAFGALADPTRRRILTLVAERPRQAGELAQRFPMSRPAVSKHLRVLREAGLVEADKLGRARVYRLHPKGLAEARRWMEEAGKVWDSALDAFRRHVEEEVQR
ncbi:MAG: ArsR/SmtB family transcription factor [Actinomycetota bacterium]